MGRDSCRTKSNEFGEGFLELRGGIPRAEGRDSCRTKTNEIEERFLELWGGIPSLVRLMSLKRDS